MEGQESSPERDTVVPCTQDPEADMTLEYLLGREVGNVSAVGSQRLGEHRALLHVKVSVVARPAVAQLVVVETVVVGGRCMLLMFSLRTTVISNRIMLDGLFNVTHLDNFNIDSIEIDHERHKSVCNLRLRV